MPASSGRAVTHPLYQCMQCSCCTLRLTLVLWLMRESMLRIVLRWQGDWCSEKGEWRTGKRFPASTQPSCLVWTLIWKVQNLTECLLFGLDINLEGSELDWMFVVWFGNGINLEGSELGWMFVVWFDINLEGSELDWMFVVWFDINLEGLELDWMFVSPMYM